MIGFDNWFAIEKWNNVFHSKSKLEELLTKAKYFKRKEYEDKFLNDFFNYWMFLEEEEELIQRLTNESIEVILYSKYYWSLRYKKRYEKLCGEDVSVEQQQYKIIEELDQRIDGEIDWSLMKLIEDDNL